MAYGVLVEYGDQAGYGEQGANVDAPVRVRVPHVNVAFVHVQVAEISVA